MSDTGWDPRKPSAKKQNLNDVIAEFVAAVPEGQLCVNLGSGQNPMPGFVNVDGAAIDGVDVVTNLFTYPWPFEDASIGLVYMSHFMEHVPDWTGFWNEMWRVCAEGARVVIIAPHKDSDRFDQDPTHFQKLSDRKFLYLSKNWRTANGIEHYGSAPDINFAAEYNTFKIYHPNWAHREQAERDYAELHYRNVVDDCCWFLRAYKSDEAWAAHLKAVEQMAQGKLLAGKPINEGAN